MAERAPIGRLLVERGIVGLAAVEDAALAALSSDSRLCSKLLELGACDESDLAAALAERHGIPGVDLSRTAIDLAALEYVPQGVAEADLLLPLSNEGGRLHVAVASPELAERVVSEVRFVTGRDVSLYVAVLASLRTAIAAAYQARGQGAAVWRGPAAPSDASPVMAVAAARGEDILELSVDDLLALEPAPGGSGADVAGTPAAEQVVHAVSVRAGPRRVLVVDDEPAIRLLVQRSLEHRGFAVDTAADGLEALEKARAGRADLVLLDAMLPKLHGFEVARRLRADPATRALPIVIMTAVYRGWRFAQDARESYGAQDYIEKPFRVDDLLRRIEAVLEARDTRPTAAAVALVASGRAAMAEGRLDQAAEMFDEATRADPFSVEAFQESGEALRAKGDAFRAMSAFERAVELRPGLLPALTTLAALYLEKGFRAKAAETLERAVHAAREPATRDQLRQELLRLL
jgi:DNA-binding response OmpR family regulator